MGMMIIIKKHSNFIAHFRSSLYSGGGGGKHHRCFLSVPIFFCIIYLFIYAESAAAVAVASAVRVVCLLVSFCRFGPFVIFNQT